MKNNQTEALNAIVRYIVKYQNSFVYSYLFEKNLAMLLEKGIYLKDLLESEIICHEFDFDENEWPQTHTDNRYMIKPYNMSVFYIRT